jgi:hypothetical protein
MSPYSVSKPSLNKAFTVSKIVLFGVDVNMKGCKDITSDNVSGCLSNIDSNAVSGN